MCWQDITEEGAMLIRILAVLAASLAGVPAAPAHAAAAPAAGDTYVYRVTNKYNKETRGEIRVRVDKVDASGSTVTVTPGSGNAGAARTEVYDRDGNWLRHPVQSRGKPAEYVFATPYPAYVFPLEAGKSWSLKVKATPPEGGRARIVRVDAKVLRAERVRVPAGEFDTLVIQRRSYAGDADQAYSETRTDETEWYAPALKQTVRLERTSEWRDFGMCGRGSHCDMRGDWDFVELTEIRAGKR
jgi:hypothetical protein